jgi:hypothetical protein
VRRFLFHAAVATVLALAAVGIGGLILAGPGAFEPHSGAGNESTPEKGLSRPEALRLSTANVTLANYCGGRAPETAGGVPRSSERVAAALGAVRTIVSIARTHPHARLSHTKIRDVLKDDSSMINECMPDQSSRLELVASGLP